MRFSLIVTLFAVAASSVTGSVVPASRNEEDNTVVNMLRSHELLTAFKPFGIPWLKVRIS
jgi:hypothetical protein